MWNYVLCMYIYIVAYLFQSFYIYNCQVIIILALLIIFINVIRFREKGLAMVELYILATFDTMTHYDPPPKYVIYLLHNICTNDSELITSWLIEMWTDLKLCQLCWRHQMETFSALLALSAEIHRSPVNYQHKGQWRCFLWSAPWTNGWVNNREAGDLRRQCAHYIMTSF